MRLSLCYFTHTITERERYKKKKKQTFFVVVVAVFSGHRLYGAIRRLWQCGKLVHHFRWSLPIAGAIVSPSFGAGFIVESLVWSNQ